MAVASAPIHVFLEFLLTSTRQNILSKPVAAFQHNHCQNNGQRGERNESRTSVAMTIINPHKEYWPSQGSNQPLPVLKSATLAADLWGLASSFELHYFFVCKMRILLSD